ncbi:hypothetical protein M9978_08375 [Sphingomonas sp. MG17]|uniref:Uncharacterized protein n=1 Tax=Sphingomonas tagetis TaxID=2949092 RepID=A0A9X2HN85_9SPHN|nr:hypothetical protein [Sphingomonas tagetis]MCP3730443.1 hypothetical protein [Sphingomonas tagetis]
MSLGVCVPDLIARGKIGEKHAGEVRALYDDLLRQYDGRMGREAAEALATQQALAAWEKGLKQGRREKLLQLKRQMAMLAEARTGYRGADPQGVISGKAMEAFLAYDGRASYANVEYREEAIRKLALGQLYGLLERHRADLLGNVRHKSDLLDVVRELFGGDTGNLNAREIAGAWRETADGLRQRFNAAGGSIGKREDWGLPQSHDAQRVGSVTPEAWIGEVRPMLDRAKMLDERTALPLTDQQLDVLLRDVYENIVSEGWVGRQPGRAGAKMLANRRAEHRVLHFKDAETWIGYNDKFGQASPWDAMMGHVRGMSRDIALMEVLGPNPAATVRWMKDVATKDAMTRGTNADRRRAKKSADMIDRLYGVISGDADQVGSETLAHLGSALRNWQAATKLGSAVIASMSDAGTATLTRRMNGLAALTQLTDMAGQLSLIDPKARVTARRMGIIGDEFTGRAAGAGRVMLDELTGGRLSTSSEGVRGRIRHGAQLANESTRRLADGTLRISGLNAWTQAGREAMGKEFAATFAERADTAFNDLPEAFRGFFERYGMGSREWDTLRATAPNKAGGYDAIWPAMVADKGVGTRVMEAMLTEIDFAVPTGGLRQRAIVGGYKRGTIMGELVRTGFQFKMFPVTVMVMHGMRMLDQPSGWRMAKYGVGFLAATTLMGALAVQGAELVKGRDPIALLDDEGGLRTDFWWKAMLKGGGLGVFGDVVNASTNQYGQDVGDLTAGPGFGTIQNVADLAWGRKAKDAEGNDVRVHDVARFLKRETPVIGSLWYTRAAWERIALDQLGELQHESYADSYGRLEKRAREDGTAYWMPPGVRGPVRAPDLLGASPDGEPIDGEEPQM